MRRLTGIEHRTLGRTGCAVSSLALGTMTFGNETEEPGSQAQQQAFVEAGGNLVDTADVYTRGAAEDVNDLGLSRRHLQRALEDSLRRLGVDCVDLY